LNTVEPTVRKFTLSDAMILIAALAVGLIPALHNLPYLGALLDHLRRELGGGIWENHRLWFFLFGSPRLAERITFGTLLELIPFLVCWTAALLGMRLRQPRPRWRDLTRQPGLWSCAAPLVALFAFPWWAYFGIRLPRIIVPGAVGVAWVVLALSQQWRPERSWIDRAGRMTGLVWLAMAVPCIYWFGFG
jgi:hypothetical protein